MHFRINLAVRDISEIDEYTVGVSQIYGIPEGEVKQRESS